MNIANQEEQHSRSSASRRVKNAHGMKEVRKNVEKYVIKEKIWETEYWKVILGKGKTTRECERLKQFGKTDILYLR